MRFCLLLVGYLASSPIALLVNICHCSIVSGQSFHVLDCPSMGQFVCLFVSSGFSFCRVLMYGDLVGDECLLLRLYGSTSG